jgi:intracellular sulfur oxidation DsrE/DsrF family protein
MKISETNEEKLAAMIQNARNHTEKLNSGPMPQTIAKRKKLEQKQSKRR